MDKLAKAVDNLAIAMPQPLTSRNGAVRSAISESVPEAFYRASPASDRDLKLGFYVSIVGASRIAPHSRYPLISCPLYTDTDRSLPRPIPANGTNRQIQLTIAEGY